MAAAARLDEVRRAAQAADAQRGAAERQFARVEPEWKEWVEREKRVRSLDGDRRMADQAVTVARQECQRLDRELADALNAREQLKHLGPELEPVERLKRELGELERQLQAIVDDGKFFRQRLEQLAQPPAAVTTAEAERDALRDVSRRASERAGELRAQAQELTRATQERAGAQRRARDLEAQLGARPTGYDSQRHDAVRAELTRLEPVVLEAAKLAARAERAEVLVREAELAEQALTTHERRAEELAAAVAAERFSEVTFAAARERHDQAARALREAELAVAETRGELVAAEAGIHEVERRERERAARERQIAELRAEERLHHELGKAFSDLRGELNAAMRPEIAELASGFLADLTDGRYEAVDLNEDYVI